MILHAGLIALRGRGRWRGVLIEGDSGAGKSDLALRALASGWRLVADDRTLIWTSDGRLFGRAPDPLAGLIEARGLGVLPARALAFAEVELVAHCCTVVERAPELACERLLDLTLPRLGIVAFEESAPLKLAHALSLLDSGANRRIKRPAPAGPTPGAGGVP
ncbi:MAG TPA: HPr kinase/phosphorylase [Caulobacteraceae bacterium]|jgi:serine kinase of HPr protein (carbohydrate metabolism regulator)|nr:HPr kinase/phosphorylase [Caulobacteraceae bacterium]